jgi:hypothetical protein
MQLQEDNLRNQIALGWAMKLVILVTMLVFMTIESILADNNFRWLRFDPGVEGLKLIGWVVALHALMPIYVYLVHGVRSRIARWIAVVLAVLGFLFFFLHHLAHWQYGQRPDLSSHVLDVVMHLIALWVIVCSVKWARYPRAARADGEIS